MVFLDSATVGETDFLPLLELGLLTLYPLTSPEKRIERIHDHEVVITNKVVIDKKIMDACPSLKLICIAATGMNNVDLEYAKEKGIPVMNVAGYSTGSVAQVTFAMIFHLMNHLNYYDSYVKNGEYSKSPVFTHHGKLFNELSGKTFGIIGLGNIGKKVADIAEAFGANVVYFSTSGKNMDFQYKNVSLNELLKISDIVSVHAPLNEFTKNLVAKKELLQMKPSSILINTGRGGIVNEHDLAGALNQNKIAGAGIDVFTEEPLSSDNPLLTVKNKDKLVLTPHIAWASIEARKLLVQKIASNIKSFLNG